MEPGGAALAEQQEPLGRVELQPVGETEILHQHCGLPGAEVVADQPAGARAAQQLEGGVSQGEHSAAGQSRHLQ